MTIKYSGDNITFSDSSIQSTAATGFGFKNRIINGAMMIDQRNAGASVSVTTNGQYTLDRWQHAATQSGKFSVQQNAGSVTPPTGFANYFGVTSSSAYAVLSGDTFDIQQPIEGFNVSDLAWGTASAQTVTISFWVRSSLTGTFGGALTNSSANRSYPFSYTISAANTWEQKAVTIAGDTTGTWLTNNGIGIVVRFGLGSGSSFSGTAGSWQTGNLIQPTSTVSVVGTNGATFYITGVDLRKGSVGAYSNGQNDFDYRPYSTELALCQRYFVRMIDPPLRGVVGAVTDASRVACSLPVQMRSAPTITFSQVGATGNARFFDGTVSTGVISTLNNQYSTTQRIELDVTTTVSTYTVGRASCLYIDTAGNYSTAFNITAEL